MCMYVSVDVIHMYVCMYVWTVAASSNCQYMYVCVFGCRCTCRCIHMYVCMYGLGHRYLLRRLIVSICMRVYVVVDVHVHICMCVYVCVCICTHMRAIRQIYG